MDPGLNLLGGLSAAAFLRDHWQKKPLLVRQALPGFKSPLTPEELAGLACEAEVESRLVLERGGAHPWELRHGPFAEDEFPSLPTSHWSLLVQEVNKHLPEAAALLEHFRFIPDWRVDDVMVSFAPACGSVGPHTDSYDVFLLQAQGRRRWSIGAPGAPHGPLLPGLDLRILTRFDVVQEWILEPGDLLYLPPDTAHHGVALEDCQTWSIGFRAPSQADLLGALAHYLSAGLERELRYEDPDLQPPTTPGLIPPATLERARTLARQALDEIDPAEWFGRLVTSNRAGPGAEPPPRPIGTKRLAALLATRDTLQRSDLARFAYSEASEGTRLFVDGQCFRLEPGLAHLAPALCGGRLIPTAELKRGRPHPGLLDLLTRLYNAGYLHFGPGEAR